jgi:alcohol dehydrogenase
MLTLEKPADLTRASGLDTLSQALESIWNRNVNPVSARHAVDAARSVRHVLPRVLDRPGDVGLRTAMAEAALVAGLAFSNTKTAIAHNISYPLTLEHGVAHGVACSFTLPHILRSVAESGGLTGEALSDIFGPDLETGADDLTRELSALGVSTSFAGQGVDDAKGVRIIEAAFDGQRGRNFIGDKAKFLTTARRCGLIGEAPPRLS